MTTKVGLISLGCDKNLVDSEFMLGILKKNNFTITNNQYEADVIIINTCGFIENAKQESIDTILEMSELKEKGNCKFIIAAGCLAQRYGEELLSEIPELDAVIGTGDFYKIPEVIKSLGSKRINLTQNKSFIDYDIHQRVTVYPYIAFVKVAEGCSNCCSYCAIPKIRGPYKSRKLSSIKKEVENLTAQGIKEINLVAQDTTNYGADLYGKSSLSMLLKELEKIPGDFWIRILYAYPNNIDDDLIDTIKNSDKIVKYLDIPLQHINDRLLKLMNRPNSYFIKQLIEKIRKKIPDITLRTTFIVGFPTETHEEFEQLMDFVRNYEFERVGAFKYSREEGTFAYNLKPQVPEKIKNARYNELMMLQRSISKKKNVKLKGRLLKVLAERYDTNKKIFEGRCPKDAPFVDGMVKFYGDGCNTGHFYTVKIMETTEYDLFGKVVLI